MKRLSFILLALLAFGPMAWAQQTTYEYVNCGQIDWSGNYLMGVIITNDDDEDLALAFSGGFLSESEIPNALSNNMGMHFGTTTMGIKWESPYLTDELSEAAVLMVAKSSYDPLHYSIRLAGGTNSSTYLYVGDHGLEVSATEPVNHYWNFTYTEAGVKMFDPNIGDDYNLYLLICITRFGDLSERLNVVFYMDRGIFNQGCTFQDHEGSGASYVYDYWYPDLFKDPNSGNASNEPLGEVALPYSFDFEDAGEMVNYWTTEYSMHQIGNGYFEGGYVGQSTYFPRTGRYGLKFNYSSEISYLISPELTGEHPNGLHVEFYYRALDEEFLECFQVGYSTSSKDINDFNFGSLYYYVHSPIYQRFAIDFPAETKYVAIRHIPHSYTNYYQYAFYIDDIIFRESAHCREPKNIVSDYVNTTSQRIYWDAGGSETQWDLYYTSVASDVPDETTTPSYSGLTTTSCNLTGLSSGTAYYVYVRGLCSETETSDWSMPYIFYTECVDIALPYSCDFSSNLSLPLCWNYLNSKPTINAFYIVPEDDEVTGSCLSFVLLNAEGTLVAVLPKVGANYPLNRFQVSFKAAWAGLNTTTQGHLTIGVMTDPDDLNTFQAIQDVTIANTYIDNIPTHNYQTFTVSLSSYTGSGQYIAIKNYGYPGIVYFDDLEVTAPHILSITGYGNDVSSGNWNLIASPVGTVSFNDVINLRSNTYDLYRFNQAAELEWENCKNTTEHPDFTTLVSGKGYLYANSQNVTLVFPNTPYNGTGTVDLEYSTDNPNENMHGWNLIGNPFATAATLDKPFFRMNEGGTGLSAQVEANSSVAAMEGVFVQATQTEQIATFTQVNNSKGGEKSGVPMININLSRNRGEAIANAIVRFDHGETLGTFSLHEDDSKIYITQDGKDYAVARSNGEGEIPVSFKPKENGTYTISVNAEGLEMNYLHLIDNMTGADIDLLATSSYTFTSKTTDYESRFKLVFSANGASTGSGTFAYMSDGNIIINGEGVLQVVDVMGRIIVSSDVARNVSTAGMTPGVYVLRLINDNDVKTQKIVVK